MPHAFFQTLKTFTTASGKGGLFHSLPALAKTYPGVARMPISMRIVLESVLRNCEIKTSASQLTGANNDFKLFPNPADSRLFLNFLGVEGLADVTVFDVLGRVVIHQMMDQRQSSALDVSGLKPGFYVVWIRDGVKTGKASFVKK